MARTKLIKRVVDRLTATNPKGERTYDIDLHGFGVAVYPTGVKAFFVEWGPERRRRRKSLGKYGVLTVDEARKFATRELAKATIGQDVAEEKRRNREALTFAQWSVRYETGAKQRKKSYRDDKRYLALARERWTGKRLDAITSDDVERLFRTIAAKHKTAGNRFLASVRTCLQEAWRLDLIDVNPAAKVKANPESAPRARVLTDEEYGRLRRAVDGRPDPIVRTAFRLLMATGARLSEVLRSRWSDFDLDAGTWRIPSPKAGHPQMVALTPDTVALLRNAPRFGPLLVPSVSNPEKSRFDLADEWVIIRTAAELADVRIHDIRRDYGLRLAKIAGLHTASKVLRHADIRVTERVYAPLGLDDLRKGMEKASAKAEKLAKVLPMSRQAKVR